MFAIRARLFKLVHEGEVRVKAHIFKIADNGVAAFDGAPNAILHSKERIMKKWVKQKKQGEWGEREAYIKAMEKRVRFPFANGIKGCENWGEKTI